jgi:hypothetical protein
MQLGKACLLHQRVGAIVVALFHTESLSGSANGSEQGTTGKANSTITSDITQK